MSICDKCNHNGTCGFQDDTTLACNHFQKEVVRCKDCKHYKPQFQGVHRNCKTPYCMRCTAVKVSPDDFCSYGERREGE